MSLVAAEGYDKVKLGFRYISSSTWHYHTIREVYRIGSIIERGGKVTIGCHVKATHIIYMDKDGKLINIDPYGAHSSCYMHTDTVWKARQDNIKKFGELFCELVL